MTTKLNCKIDLDKVIAELQRLRGALEKIAEIECHAEEGCDCKRRIAQDALGHPHPPPDRFIREQAPWERMPKPPNSCKCGAIIPDGAKYCSDCYL